MNEFKVGILTLLTMAAITVMSVMVTSNQSGFGDYVRYTTVVKDASGIFPKTPIRVAGINAGRIVRIELQDNFALITFEVRKDVRVPEDSILRIKTVGFLGDKYIEIVTGRSSTVLAEMSMISADEGGGMEDLLNDAGVILKDVKALVGTFREVFAPEGEPSPLEQVMSDLKSVGTQLNGTLTENRARLAEIMANIEQLSRQLADETNKELDESAVAKLHAILGNTYKMTDDLQMIAADLRAGKGTVGKLLVEEEIADEVRQTLASVRKIVSRVDSLRTELSVFSGANTEYGSETEAEIRLWPSPERFYLLGITTSEFGVEEKKIFRTEQNGVSTRRVESIQEQDTYRFNVQLGRKLQNWTFRGGLIQSTGGFGVDYEVPHWGLKLSTEVYDYRKEIGVNWRVMSELQLWNVVYGKLAFEDIIENERSATLSAGLRFTDEDLKGLIGFFF